MTATVKTVDRKPPTFAERIYLPAILKGLVHHLRCGMFKKKVTMQYPEENWEVHDGYRGAPVLVKDDDGPPEVRGLLALRVRLPAEGDLHPAR